jgi:hypothetical protein
VAVRAASHSVYDRVVFEFDGPVGGYFVSRVPQVTQDGSGEAVRMLGESFLSVAVQGSTKDTTYLAEDPPRVYTGPERLAPDLPNLVEIAGAGDFEAVLSFGIGLRDAAGFRAFHLTGPDRLVIDVAH